MSISTNYPQPITVNGFSCKNCTDVDYAKKHIDPAHPKSGPYGIDAKSDPTNTAVGDLQKTAKSDSFIKFGGSLSQGQTASPSSNSDSTPSAAVISASSTTPGQTLNIQV